jgi:hypothetical protein
MIARIYDITFSYLYHHIILGGIENTNQHIATIERIAGHIFQNINENILLANQNREDMVEYADRRNLFDTITKLTNEFDIALKREINTEYKLYNSRLSLIDSIKYLLFANQGVQDNLSTEMCQLIAFSNVWNLDKPESTTISTGWKLIY